MPDHFPVLRISQEELSSYVNLIVVAGSRSYSNYIEFDGVMTEYVKLKRFDKANSVFITGEASRGPDNMVIEWCESHGWKYCGFPADWDTHGKAAGFLRNIEMKKVATHVIVFWDMKSPGSRHMYTISASDKNVQTVLVVITHDDDYYSRKQGMNHGWKKPDSSGELHRPTR